MKRRKLFALFGGAAAWPLAARAQQPAMPVIGFLSTRSSGTDTQLLVSLRQGLGEAGFVEGRNVAFEYRYAEGQLDRLPSLVADLVRRQVAIIVTTGGVQGALAAKAATTTIPIVFTTGGDPVREGLVSSLNHPEGNLTGATTSFGESASKRLGLLREIAPKAAVIGVLVNPNDSVPATNETNDVRTAARSVGDVSTRPRQAGHKTLSDRIVDDVEYDRDGAGRLFQCGGNRRPASDDEVRCRAHQFCRVGSDLAQLSTRISMLDSDIAVLGPPERLESLPKRNDAGQHFRIVLSIWMEERDATYACRLLRRRRERPRCRCAAEKANELTSPHIRTQAKGPALYRQTSTLIGAETGIKTIAAVHSQRRRWVKSRHYRSATATSGSPRLADISLPTVSLWPLDDPVAFVVPMDR